jgi:hypothetical protein
MPIPVVLVHSPLVGPSTWDALAQAIPERDYTVLIPDLTASLSEGPLVLDPLLELMQEL